MDETYLSNHFKNFRCLSCNSHFSFKAFSTKGSKNPLLLECGHSLCYSCVRVNFKTSKTITCPKCQISHSTNSKSMPEDFSFNLYAIGVLTVFQFEKHEKEKKLAMLTTGDGNFHYSVRGKQYDFDADNKDALCEECSGVACWSCKNCLCNYCDPCWSKVHAAAKSLMKHIRTPASAVDFVKNDYRKCPSHEVQNLELFCKSCRKAVCSYCVIERHHNEEHCLISLKEQNLEMINHLKTIAEEAEVTCKRMKHTLQKIKFTQTSLELPENYSISNVKNQVSQNFARLHGILQLQEEKLLKQLNDKVNERDSKLRVLGVQLETQIQKTEFLLEKYEAFVKKPQPYDWNTLHDELLEVKTLPCYLISKKYGCGDPKVSFDESLIQTVENFCTIELPSNEVFELRSDTDLPEDFAVEPLPVSNYDQRISAQTISASNSDVDTVSNCSSRDLCECTETSKSNCLVNPNKFCENRKYSVRITYINNPGNFYVTLNSQKKIKDNIEKKVASYNYPIVNFSRICKDDLSLVKYKVDEKWYRGRIVEILPEDKNGQVRAVVHYIDYGNTDTVPSSWIKPLPADLTEDPPLAIKCKLFDCIPKNDKWSNDSVTTMEKIVDGLTATLFVMKIHPDCLEVDLSVVYPDGEIGRDIVSVRDALIFLEFATFVGGAKTQKNAPATKYEEQCLPSRMESFGAVITHVNSPDDFYLHQTNQDGLFLCKLGIDLQNYYNENLKRGIIYNPVVGMPCAAKFSADKKWYRAVIENLPGKKMITVYYVDYGNKETIPWTDVRKLRENFVKRPPLAINCSLAKIQSVILEDWKPEAKAYLRKCVLTKGISVQVEGVHESEPKLKVLLCEQLGNKNICINNLFVEMGFATPLISELESLTKFVRDSQKVWKKNNEGGEQQENFNKNILLEKKRKRRLSAKELRANYESEKLQYYENAGTEDENESSEEIESLTDCTFKVKVEVLSAESPSSIYVTFLKGSENLRNLQILLNNFYENTAPLDDKEWFVDNKCALYNSDTKTWCRASISKIVGDGTVKAFLKDFATTVTVPLSSLRELDPIFTKYGPYAIKCHLADVAPPGETWPGISCEYLESEIEGYSELYITKKGHIENNSLPIELWVQKIIPGSALEPTNIEWITLNKLLVEKGLAVPKNNLWFLQMNNEESAPSSEKETESNCETKIVKINSTFLPSLSDHWLPPKPLVKFCFTGIPTYVDENGYIFIQDLEDQQELIDIRDSLREEYMGSKPSPEDHFWSPEQMCIAKYFADNDWYRGVVTKTTEVGNYEVLFVDYGNTETLQVANLRKRVKKTDIPILVHKFKLHNIAPLEQGETFSTIFIEVLHSLVVDKKCEVRVHKQSHDLEKPHVASLNLIEVDQDISELLIKENLARSLSNGSESPKSIDDLNKEKEEITSPGTEILNPEVGYSSLSIPKDCKKFQILVKALKSENEFYGHVVEDELLPLFLKTALKQFPKLEKTLAEECHLQPKLANVSEGSFDVYHFQFSRKERNGGACCCVHSGINKWCRGEIKTVGDNCICVFYVDYGYKEFLSTELVHECKLEWQKLPKMALNFYIPKIEKPANVSKAAFMKALTSCFIETKFYVEVLDKHEDCLEVELVTEKGDVLAYNEMLGVHLNKTT